MASITKYERLAWEAFLELTKEKHNKGAFFHISAIRNAVKRKLVSQGKPVHSSVNALLKRRLHLIAALGKLVTDDDRRYALSKQATLILRHEELAGSDDDEIIAALATNRPFQSTKTLSSRGGNQGKKKKRTVKLLSSVDITKKEKRVAAKAASKSAASRVKRKRRQPAVVETEAPKSRQLRKTRTSSSTEHGKKLDEQTCLFASRKRKAEPTRGDIKGKGVAKLRKTSPITPWLQGVSTSPTRSRDTFEAVSELQRALAKLQRRRDSATLELEQVQNRLKAFLDEPETSSDEEEEEDPNAMMEFPTQVDEYGNLDIIPDSIQTLFDITDVETPEVPTRPAFPVRATVQHHVKQNVTTIIHSKEVNVDSQGRENIVQTIEPAIERELEMADDQEAAQRMNIMDTTAEQFNEVIRTLQPISSDDFVYDTRVERVRIDELKKGYEQRIQKLSASKNEYQLLAQVFEERYALVVNRLDEMIALKDSHANTIEDIKEQLKATHQQLQDLVHQKKDLERESKRLGDKEEAQTRIQAQRIADLSQEMILLRSLIEDKTSRVQKLDGLLRESQKVTKEMTQSLEGQGENLKLKEMKEQLRQSLDTRFQATEEMEKLRTTLSEAEARLEHESIMMTVNAEEVSRLCEERKAFETQIGTLQKQIENQDTLHGQIRDVKALMKELQNSNEESRGRVEELTSKAQRLNHAVDDLQLANDLKSNEIKKNERTIGTLSKELKASCAELQEQIFVESDFQGLLKVKQDEFEAYKKNDSDRIKGIEANLKESEHWRKAFELRAGELEGLLRRAQKASSDKSDKIIHLEVQIRGLEDDLEGLKNQLGAKMTELATVLKNFAETNLDTEAHIKESKVKFTNKEDELAAMRNNSAGRISELEQELSQVRGELDGARVSLNKSQDQYFLMKEEFEVVEKSWKELGVQLGELKTLCETQETQITSQMSEIDSARRESQECCEMTTKVGELEYQLRGLSALQSCIETREMEVREQQEMVSLLRDKYDKLNLSHEDSTNHVQELLVQLQQATEKLQDTEAQLASKDGFIEKKARRISEIEDQLLLNVQRVEELDSRVQVLTADVERERDRTRNFGSELRVADIKVIDITKAREHLQTTLLEQEKRLERFKDIAQRRQSELANLRMEADYIVKERAVLQREVILLQETQKLLEQRLECPGGVSEKMEQVSRHLKETEAQFSGLIDLSKRIVTDFGDVAKAKHRQLQDFLAEGS